MHENVTVQLTELKLGVSLLKWYLGVRVHSENWSHGSEQEKGLKMLQNKTRIDWKILVQE